MFPDAPSIAPYLEHPQTGPTSAFCAELARHLQCYVVAGFPERLESPSDTTPNPSSECSASSESPRIGANAAVLFDSTGQPLHTYHKSNLFQTDLPWARPGPGFAVLDLPHPFGRTAIAICNDLNVNGNVREEGTATGLRSWVSIEAGPYELAGYCLRENVRLLVLLNAWLKPDEDGQGAPSRTGGDDDGTHNTGSDEDSGSDVDVGESDVDGDGLEPNWHVLNYWAMRLRPLWAKDIDVGGTQDTKPEGTRQSETSASAGVGQDVIVVICNRFGRERGTTVATIFFFLPPWIDRGISPLNPCLGKVFVGSSAMFSMRRGSGKPRLLSFMGEREEGVCMWTVPSVNVTTTPAMRPACE